MRNKEQKVQKSYIFSTQLVIIREYWLHSEITGGYTAISIKVVHEQSGKVEYERERLLGIANKLINFQSGSQQPFALVFDFSALLVDNLNLIAVYNDMHDVTTR
jgi:hypothetical protein